MTDAKPVAERIDELEREAADVEDISPLAIRGAFEQLAAIARRLLTEAEAAERAAEWHQRERESAVGERDKALERATAAERALADERRNFLLAENALGDKK